MKMVNEKLKRLKSLLRDNLRTILSNGGYYLGRDDEWNDVVCGFMTSGFKLKDVKGECAVFHMGLLNPKIGNFYRVKIGDPSVFTADYIGDVESSDFLEVIKELFDVFEEGLILFFTGTLSVFHQDGEYLFYVNDCCEFHSNNWLSRLFGR